MTVLPIRNTSHHPLPRYQSGGAAGMDIQAFLQTPVTLLPLERKIIPTGLYTAAPEGYEIQIRARSGMAFRHGITLANGVGTIDSDYRGEIGVILVNLSNEPYEIKDGDRIAQMVVAKVENVRMVEVEELTDTERSDGGFGHSGY